MKLALGGVLAFCCAFALCGCGSDDKSDPVVAAGGDGAAAMNDDGGSPATNNDDPCRLGCVETVAAKCSNGPTDQASCETTCNTLSAGTCGGEYATFQTCAKGKAVTCSAQGQPIVTECSDQQAAFVACLNH